MAEPSLSDLLLGRVNRLMEPPPVELRNPLLGPPPPTQDAATPPSHSPLGDLAHLLRFGSDRTLDDTTRDVNRFIGRDPTMTDREREELVSGFLGIGNITRISNPIRAYHGSPHRFDEFRLDRIGTGEGAQSYGHGLYFAENEGVARSYRDALAWNAHTAVEDLARGWINSFGGRARAIEELERTIARSEAARLPSMADAVRRDREVLDYLKSAAEPPRGHMYEVNLHARPEQFLDWDRSLLGQPRHVQEYFGRRLRLPPQEGLPELSAEEMRRLIGRSTEDAASAGIPGIRYLDAGSRAGGTGTHNFVVWSPEVIEILRRYGLMAPVAGTALLGGAAHDRAP